MIVQESETLKPKRVDLQTCGHVTQKSVSSFAWLFIISIALLKPSFSFRSQSLWFLSLSKDRCVFSHNNAIGGPPFDKRRARFCLFSTEQISIKMTS
jgi:hypothetical protein